MTRSRRIWAAVAALVLASGCAHVHMDATHALVPVSMTSRIGRPGKVIGHFKKPVRTSFLVWRLWTIRDVEVNDAVESAVAQWGGDGVANLRIVGETGVVDSLLNYGIGFVAGVVTFSALRGPTARNPVPALRAAALTFAEAGLAGATTSLWAPFFRTYTVEGDVVKFGVFPADPSASNPASTPAPPSPPSPAPPSGSAAPASVPSPSPAPR